MLLQPITPNSISVLQNMRWDVPLVGVRDSYNDLFTTPEKFIQTATVKIRVYVSGRRLTSARDYLVSESGGVGTGYDTVLLLFPPGKLPNFSDSVYADYTKA
jgi:hypothetical protein